MPDTPLNPDAERQCVELLLEYRGTPMHRLYEYPHRADDSDRYIANAKSLLSKILTVAQPEVNSVEELDALPYGSFIVGDSGVAVLKFDGSNYDWVTGSDARYRMDEQMGDLPARVLYRPELKP